MSDETMCYAARFPNTVGYGAISVDMPGHEKDTAKDVSRWMRKGAKVYRVTVEQAKSGMLEYLNAKKSSNI